MSDSAAGAHSLTIRVYYEDTDASGVVYHAGYLRYFERARTEWLRSRGFSQQQLAQQHQIAFTVSEMNLRFAAPAHLDDLLDVSAEVVEWRRASLIFLQSLRRQTTRQLLAQARVRVACVDVPRFRPRGLPEAIRDGLLVQKTH